MAILHDPSDNYLRQRSVLTSEVIIDEPRFPSLKFPLGRIVATPGALDAIARAGETPLDYLRRHARGDWGDLDERDRTENELSVRAGFRLVSAYDLRDGARIWILTEADRSLTTILLPSEY